MVTIKNNEVVGPEELYIPAHLSCGQFLLEKLKAGGDRVALMSADTGKSVTYRQLLQNSVNIAVTLQKLGLKKGDVVSLCSENRFEFIETALAVMYCGAVLSTLNVTYTPGEILHMFNITKPKFIFTSPLTALNIQESSVNSPSVEKIILYGDHDVIPALMYNNLVKQQADIESFYTVDVNGVKDTLAVMCSSGTTGMPKGVMLTHVNFLTLFQHLRYYMQTSMSQKRTNVETYLALIPWFHAYGFSVTCAVMSMHIKNVFLVRFEEQQFLETVQNYKVNMMTIVPPLAVFLAKHPLVLKYDLSSLNEVWCGAAPLSQEIQNAVSKRLKIGHIRQGYGLTEMTMACCVDIGNGEASGSCGPPAPGMRVKVLDIETGKKQGVRQEGEIWLKSPLRMKGYMGDEASGAALFDSEGFCRTGDIGYYDEMGNIYIVDRLKELIKYKGFQVAPAELEALLLQLGGVAQCGVVGAPCELAGELPAAFVVLQPGVTLSEQEVLDYVASRVSSAKRLRGGVIFVDDIPKNASGKILRRELRKMLPKPKSKL